MVYVRRIQRAQQSSGRKGFLQSQNGAGYRCGAVRAFHFSEKHLQRRVFFPDGPSANENSGVMSSHYPNWPAEAGQLGFKLCSKTKRHSASGGFASIRLTVLARQRNPIPAIIPAIVGALACLFRGVLRFAEEAPSPSPETADYAALIRPTATNRTSSRRGL